MSIYKGIAKQVLSYFPYKYVNVGKEFYAWLAHFERMKRMSVEQIQAEQFRMFVDMVTYAYQETPFYRNLYDLHVFHPRQLKDFQDVKRIPVINKAMVKASGENMISTKFKPGKLSQGATSGSTGQSLPLYYNRTLDQREWAATCFMWSEVGYRPGDGRVEFRGYIPGEEDYIVDAYHRVLRVNVSRLTSNNITKILQLIQRFGYRYIHGYPSSLSLVSKLILENNLVHQIQPAAILLASETLYDYQENTIRKAFPGTVLHAHYGQSEKVVMAGKADYEPGYSFLPLYGYAEFHPDSRAVIGTSFINNVTPFIRYEIMDIVSPPIAAAPTHYLFPTIQKIEGRVGEIMYKPNKDMVPSALVAIAVRGTESVTACKLVQHHYNKIDIMLETTQNEEHVLQEMKPVLKRLQNIFTPDMCFELHMVDHIPKEPSGKLKTVEVHIS
ncbi:phenylacetate--CoA ligase family protein [Paenibacillus sp. JCM 10914]|uniref:phenylacetate--CoA ligase family protein n=1 Tax=Paenibacillus sp. JCM 10914 TaxID=1236974 RepID=UPI0003CC36E5|nr:phenylacetate--CoA ligase family protein [Paenibacillus sp. JCM 10914]GAE07317.1 capsular polysaccharide biosynthesis protein, putative [Paenibacillus sp. JCM 10914]